MCVCACVRVCVCVCVTHVHRYLTTIDFSHHTMVLDLKWLPGIEISSRGKVTKAAEGSRECNYLATVAGDGRVSV